MSSTHGSRPLKRGCIPLADIPAITLLHVAVDELRSTLVGSHAALLTRLDAMEAACRGLAPASPVKTGVTQVGLGKLAGASNIKERLARMEERQDEFDARLQNVGRHNKHELPPNIAATHGG